MSTLPPIFRDVRGVIAFRCPVCGGIGQIRTLTHKGAELPSSIDPCKHCFGFGRLPVPSWYTKQIIANAVGDSKAVVDDMLAEAKGDTKDV